MQTVDLNIESHMQTVKIISQINNEILADLIVFTSVLQCFMVPKSRMFFFSMYKQEGEEHLLSYL